MAAKRPEKRLPKALDTNVVTRFIMRDDPAQARVADDLLRQPIFIPVTVLIETAWVLGSCYDMRNRAIADVLTDLFDLPDVSVDEPELAAWALARYRAGADLADMLHLVMARHAEAFATFDRALSRAAGAAAPVRVETLKG